MADRGDLTGLGLAAVERAGQQERLRSADRLHRAPEVGRGGLVGDVPQLPGQPAVLDPVEPLPGELEVVTLHVDRPGLVADHVDAALDPADQRVQGRATRGRLQGHVGHPLHRDVAGRVGERAAVGPAQALEPGHPPVELVADQRAVPDQVPLLGLHAVVVVADGGQAVLDGAVTGHGHHRRAVLQRAELLEGGEAGSRVRRLVAERAVQLGGVADRLVDRQPEVGRVDDQVVATRVDGRGLGLLGQPLRDLRQLRGPVPGVAGEVFPAPAGRRPAGAHRLEGAAGAVDRGRLQLRVQPDPLLGGDGAGQVGVELVLLHLHHQGLDVVHAVGGQQALGPVPEQRELLRVGHVERIHLVRRDPGDVRVDRLVGQLDRLRVDRAAHLGHLDRLLGHGDRGLRGQVDAGGEAPGAVVHHPDREADVLAVAGRVDPAVAQDQVLVADPLQPEVGVLGPEIAHPLQRGVRHLPHRQLEKPGIHLSHSGPSIHAAVGPEPYPQVRVTGVMDGPRSAPYRGGWFLSATSRYRRKTCAEATLPTGDE